MAFLAQKLISASGVQEETDADFNITTSLMHFDGSNNGTNNTYVDSSSTSKTLTCSSNLAQGTFSPFSADEGKWSVIFDGTDDYIDVGSSNATQLGSGDFTVEFWIRTTDTSFNIANPDSATGSSYWGLLVQSGDLRWNDSYNVSNKWVVDGAGILDDAWHHVAIVRNSGTIAVYYDGTSQSVQSGSFSDSTDYSGSDGLRIGSGNLDEFAGYLSNFRTVSGTAVYTSNYSAPTTPLTAITNTKVLVCCSNIFRDKSTSAHTITFGSTPKIQPFSPFAPSAAYDSAVNGGSANWPIETDKTNKITLSSSADFAFGTGAFTIDCWVYVTADTNPYSRVWHVGPLWNDNNAIGLVVNDTASSDKTAFCVYAAGGRTCVSTNVTPRNAWFHVACVRDSSGNFKLFINGNLDATNTSYTTTNISPGGNQTLAIGNIVETNATLEAEACFEGFISNLRVVKGTAIYSSSFTPPTAPTTDVTNTKLLANFTNAQMIDSTAKNNFETVGSVYLTSTVKQFGTTSCDLYGSTGSRVASPPSPLYNILNAGKFTVEFWIYVDNYHAAYSDIVGVFNGVSAGWLIYQNGTYIEAYINGVQLQVARPSTSTWTHIALTRDGTTARLFKDGTSGATSTSSLGADQTSYGLVFGGDATGRNGIDARIDEFRLTLGKARYTSNFTVPTQAFANL